LKAIILAAGEGKRLRPLTNKQPKCMVKLFGKSIIERQIEIFQDCNIKDISIVTGFKHEMINFKEINYFHNKKYASTNMIETLFCAREKLSETVIISYGDIIFQKEVLQKLIDSNEKISVVVDMNWKKYWKRRFENPLDDAESLILDEKNFIKNIGQKVQNINQIQGQYIGLMKFQNNGTEILKDFYDRSKLQAKNGINPLNSSVQFEKSYMTDLLQSLINAGNKIKSVPISNNWLELDTISDYELYKKMYLDNSISQFISLKK
jgi:L-glutamine-phosphate cytidylyltransferase